MTGDSIDLSDKNKKTVRPNYGLMALMVLALGFVIFLFWRLNNHKIDLPSQVQPEPEASNSADFSQSSGSAGVKMNEPNGQGNNGEITTTATVEKLIQKIDQVEIEEIILYGRDTCPHCQNVADWMSNKPEISNLVTKKWLNEDANYINEVTKVAKECQILDERGIGVPFLYIKSKDLANNEKCLMGGDVIIEFLSNLENK